MTPRVLPALSEADRELGRAIRRSVFVDEQGVPADLELDALDDSCQHFLVRLGSEAVAAARARTTEQGWKLERVAVLESHRGRAIGATLVRHLLDGAPPGLTVYVHAQETALGFWERAGFRAEGPRFFEAGILHRLMLGPSAGALPSSG
jgi:predicted GNAT family N-acyltransferase